MKPRFPMLDPMRLVAVMGVVLFHYGFQGPAGIDGKHVALPGLGAIAQYGFLGVPVFFVISGFVIANSAEGRSATEFAIARFARIYPTFVVCMTATFLAVLLFGSPEFQASFAQWAANLLIAAPGSRYVDSAYWSLVVEAIFYAWVALFIWLGLFQRRADVIIAIWLGISLLTGMTVDARWINKLLVADYSGFFTTGILLYQLRKGRRDLVLQCLLATSVMVAVYQAVHNLDWLRAETSAPFDDMIVAAICLASILVITLATHIRELPVGTGVLVAAGGMTYPLYLLHQQLGYVLLQRLGGEPYVVASLVVFLIGGISWAMWRFVERPMQSFAKKILTIFADRTGTVIRRPPAARPLS
jgi:peptidoglycan/LPS O-acetylase OafA/YrhL